MALFAFAMHGQTTQGLISGRLLNSATGRPVGGATILCSNSSTAEVSATTDAAGFYYLPLLSPGTYRVQASAAGFQAQEVQELELPVAARMDLDFRLRPLNDVWEAGQFNSVFLPGSKTIVTFFGPDVDSTKSGSFDAQKGRVGALESTISDVVRKDEMDNLPLAGRDVYAMLVTQAGVTSDGATSRGLGLSVAGQRPSASNFLLDGLENNNYLITGPLVTAAPEAIQEYRVSTNNFSAEYGKTSGFLANAVTRSGTNSFHGVGYFYMKNDSLNGNAFQANLKGRPRTPLKESQPGFSAGGPILRDRLYFASFYEHFRSRSFQDPFTFTFPATPGFFDFSTSGRLSHKLLEQYPPPPVAGNGITGQLTMSPPTSVDRTLLLERLDYTSRSGRDHVMARGSFARVTRPDFIWTPYKDFVSPLGEDTPSIAVTNTHTIRSNITNEARFGFSRHDLGWNRAHPEIPTLSSLDGVTLPGSPAFYSYRNTSNTWELLDNIIWTRGRHQVTAGAGLLNRTSSGFLTAGHDGMFLFSNILAFALDRPSFFRVAISRASLPDLQIPDSNRNFLYRQYFAFVQDAFKLSSRLNFNYGLRYEQFGSPSNTGAVKDMLVQFGPGPTLADQIASASLPKPGATGDQSLYGSDNKDFAIRAGATYDLTGQAKTLLRGAYGVFYDRPFDNLWQNVRNNSFILPLVTLPATQTDFLAAPSNVLKSLTGRTLNSNFPDLTAMDPGLKNGYAHTYFAGVQHRFSDRLTADLNLLGAYGRSLITTDVVNRDFSTPTGRYNNSLPDIAYRAGQGRSNYNALTAVAHYRSSRAFAQAAYTWSHAIDNQSEPLAGDFFNLNFTGIQASAGPNGRAAFSRQFDPDADRGNSDFDQRHNLVLFGYWDLPGRLLRGITAAALAAVRSGFPFTVIGPTDALPGKGIVLNNRPDLVNPSQAVLNKPVAVTGGQRLLSASGFSPAAPSTLGNLGRNALQGPGLYNIDFSISRSFRLRWLGESPKINVRADAYNVLNHTNLGNPDSLLTSSTFGIATYGRQGRSSGFPAVTPLAESPRQVQLSVRLDF